MTNGSLRGLTPDTLETLFPSVTKRPDVNDHLIDNLIDTVHKERDQYKAELAGQGKVVSPQLAAPVGGVSTDVQTSLRGKQSGYYHGSDNQWYFVDSRGNISRSNAPQGR
jgi:hypothetical protein